MLTINCLGKLLTFERPRIMGIINATNDSFYKGDLDAGLDAMVRKAAAMLDEGADILDLGGQSTRPDSKRLTAEEESANVIPVIQAIKAQLPQAIISVDTYYSAVAEAAVDAGAAIVNDISGGTMDTAMIKTVAKLRVPYVCMHMQGTPNTMQIAPSYTHVTQEVLDYFIQQLNICRQAGIKDVIADPGFGFGKSIAHNFQLLREFSAFNMLQIPLLAGISRKSFIYKTLGCDAAEALNGTSVLHAIALQQGAHILRVHDVQPAREAIQLMLTLKNS